MDKIMSTRMDEAAQTIKDTVRKSQERFNGTLAAELMSRRLSWPPQF